MKWRIALLVLLGLAIAGGLVAWWLHTYERVSERVDIPRTGEAASNPLFDLGVVLENDGRTVRHWRRLEPAAMALGPHDTVLYDGDLRRLPARVEAPLLDWLRGGGHLIVAAPPVDVVGDTFEPGVDEHHVRVPLLDAMGVHARLDRARCNRAPRGLPVELCMGRRFDAPGAKPRIGDGKGDLFARVAVGRGSADVVSSLGFLDEGSLRHHHNAEFAHQLIARGDRRGTVHLVHVSDMPSLWLTLLRHGWPVWLPLLLALAGWLWARMRRFGPQVPSPVAGRRSLLEHVAASGAHHWRYGRADALHLAMLDAFHARLRRRDPQAAALQGHVQVQRLVERTGLPEAQVVDALTPPDPRDRKALVARIATLVRMRNRL